MEQPALSEMETLLRAYEVPQDLHMYFNDFTPELFANVAADASGLDRFLASLVLNSGTDAFVVEARIRMLWKACQPSEQPKPEAKVASKSSNEAPDSWADPFPSKLSATTWKSLRENFLAAYPSELLSPEETPGARLMALVHKGVQERLLRWPQWRHRLSQAQEQSHQLVRPAKVPRLEALIFDEVPAKEVPSSLSYAYVAGVLNLHATALALCGACHLSTLKRYVQSFLRLCFPVLDTGFRAPSVSEALVADERAWSAINDLYSNHSWALVDAVAEIVDVRMVLHTYLQPRLAAPPAPLPSAAQWQGQRRGSAQRGRGRGRGLMGKAFGKGKQSAFSRANEVKVSGQTLIICRDFNTKEGCKRQDCKFAHVCNVPRPDGHACGGRHSAVNHAGKNQ